MRLFKVIGGIAVILASFWITLVVLDQMDPRRAGRSNVATQTKRAPATGAALFTLSLSPPNWTAATTHTRAVAAGNRVAIESDAATAEYQWMTAPVSVRANGDYVLSYQIDVSRGDMTVGIEDAASEKWVITKPIDKPVDQIHFKAPSASVRVIIYGNGRPPSAVSIARMTIAGT